jgi:hypothetical protein
MSNRAPKRLILEFGYNGRLTAASSITPPPREFQ